MKERQSRCETKQQPAVRFAQRKTREALGHAPLMQGAIVRAIAPQRGGVYIGPVQHLPAIAPCHAFAQRVVHLHGDGGRYVHTQPPSTMNSCPVHMRLSSAARNSAARAKSSAIR